MVGTIKRSDIGIGAFLGGVYLSEFLSLILSVQGIWGYLIVGVPLYAGMIYGGFWYVFPEFWRLETGAMNSPSLWRRRNVMRSGFILLVATGFVFTTSYTVPTQIFHQEITLPRVVVEGLKLVFAVAASILGAIAFISARTPYYGWRPRPRSPWSQSKILNLSSWVILLTGAITLQVFAVPAILLFAAAGATYVTGRLVRRWSNGKSGGELPAPVMIAKNVGFETRLEIAKKISDLIVQKYGKRIVAV